MTTVPAAYLTPQGLTPERRKQFLAKPVANLGTIQPDGAPHLTTLLFGLSDDDRVLLPSGSTAGDITIEVTPSKWLSWSGEASMEWILARGVDLVQHQGPWFKTLAEPQW